MGFSQKVLNSKTMFRLVNLNFRDKQRHFQILLRTLTRKISIGPSSGWSKSVDQIPRKGIRQKNRIATVGFSQKILNSKTMFRLVNLNFRDKKRNFQILLRTLTQKISIGACSVWSKMSTRFLGRELGKKIGSPRWAFPKKSRTVRPCLGWWIWISVKSNEISW